MWEIAKSFSFCYGHRVWSQKLDPELSVNGSCKCRHYHGHEARVEVGLRASCLANGMVTDFKNLTWLKEFLDTYLDHKFIVDTNDPLYEMLTREKQFKEDLRRKSIVVPSYDHDTYKGLDLFLRLFPTQLRASNSRTTCKNTLLRSFSWVLSPHQKISVPGWPT